MEAPPTAPAKLTSITIPAVVHTSPSPWDLGPGAWGLVAHIHQATQGGVRVGVSQPVPGDASEHQWFFIFKRLHHLGLGEEPLAVCRPTMSPIMVGVPSGALGMSGKGATGDLQDGHAPNPGGGLLWSTGPPWARAMGEG